MKRIHKLLFGEGAGTYLPFALSRLKELERINTNGYFSQTYEVNSAVINVRQVGEDQYIRIWIGGGFYFEFATSGWPVTTQALSSETYGLAAAQYTRMVVGTDVTVDQGNLLISPVIQEQARGNLTSRNNFLQQIQLINEPVRYVESDAGLRERGLYSLKLYEAYPPGHSHTGFGERAAMLRNTTFSWASGANTYSGWVMRDVSEDYPTAWASKFDDQTYALVHEDIDWWRAGGYHVATSEKYGSRAFALISDAYGTITAVPTTEVVRYDLPSTGNINYSAVKSVRPALPTWAWVPDERASSFFERELDTNKFLVAQPDYDWKFSPDGTKACVVAHARAAFNNDSTYFSLNPDPDTPWRTEDFDRLLQRMSLFSTYLYGVGGVDNTYKPEHYFYAAGLVEVEIFIELTGDEPEDFNLEIREVVEHRIPTAAGAQGVVYAGYAHMDIPSRDISYGDLIGLELESYSPTDWDTLNGVGYTTDGRASYDPASFGTLGAFTWTSMSFKNWTTGGNEIWCLRAQPILGIDITTLSVATKVVVDDPYNATTFRYFNGSGAEAGHRWTQEFGVAIWFAGEHKKTMYPDIMVQAKRDMIDAEVDKMKNSRQLLTDWLAADSGRQLIPLNAPEDGWAGFNNFRASSAQAELYWYNEPWVVDDPRFEVHGTIDNYPDGGWVRYRTSGFAGGDVSDESQKWQQTYAAPLALMFCDSPKFGWYRYMVDLRSVMSIMPFTTFFTHPSGTYAFWTNHLLYDSVGAVNNTVSCFTGYNGTAYLFDGLEGALDSAKWEHCIFDCIHLEVTSPTGAAAVLDTTFLDMYNQAVEAGLEAETLEEGISTITKTDLQATIAISKTTMDYGAGITYKIPLIELTWMGKKWYNVEYANRGEFSEEVYPSAFWNIMTGTSIGIQLDHSWSSTPPAGSVLGSDVSQPVFTNLNDSSTLMARFCNPQVITG